MRPLVSKLYPWDYHSDLSETRLKTVACMIVDGRHTALELYDEELLQLLLYENKSARSLILD